MADCLSERSSSARSLKDPPHNAPVARADVRSFPACLSASTAPDTSAPASVRAPLPASVGARFRTGILIACFALTVCSAGTTKPAAGKITAIRFWSLGDVTRVAIEVSSEFHYRSDRLPSPDRLFFDIQGSNPEMIAKGMHVISVGDALLKQIRVAETQPGVTRVVLDLAQPVEFTASQLSSPDRLMVELRLKDHSAPPITSSSGVKTLTDSPVRAVEPDLIAGTTPLPALNPRPDSKPDSRMDPKLDSRPDLKVDAKPEPKNFEPPLRPDPPKRDAKPDALVQPTLTPTVKAPKDPLPPPSVKPDPSLISDTRLVADARLTGPRLKDPGTEISTPAGRGASIVSSKGDSSKVESPKIEPTRIDSTREPLPAKITPASGRSLTRVLGLKLGRVVIDPGHGGHDVGTHGPSGLNEKDVVLDVSKRLGALIEARLQSEVIYTRSDDTYIPLEERTHIANERKADLFLSIHANSSPYRTAAGVETYYLNFTTSKAALDVAARENAGSERSVYDLKEILQKIALKDKIDESREFAARLQTSLYSVSSKGNAGAKNRGTKKAPFVVLIGASMPSVLAEIGFLTNAEDEALLRKPEHRQKIAEALYRGISNYADTLSHFQVAKRE
jgi:N-acetylmuramoyl-L-alanine amidase